MSLTDLLIQRIAADGPISLADYMTDCLMHPVYGYYTTKDPLGVAGDFTTAPEISQMFGELIGLSLAQTWLDQESPGPITLAECGPGRGTLMADLLRATRSVPGFHEATEIVLVETSPTLQKIQAKTLQGQSPRWIQDFRDLPQQPLFLVANEFFDALPIRQFERVETGWRERRVGLADDRLTLGLGDPLPQPALDHRLTDTKPGDLVELCPAAAPITREIGQRIADHGGAALIIDYGDWRSLGDTLQALQGHKPVDPFDGPGTADLTAHVDFEAIATATPSAYTRLTPQGIFLERLGIAARTQSLALGTRGAALESLLAAHRRLTHPEEMGNLFKAIGLYPSKAAPPPGLEP